MNNRSKSNLAWPKLLFLALMLPLAPNLCISQVLPLPPPTTDPCSRFIPVAEWKGTISIAGSGSGPLGDGGTYRYDETFTAAPDMSGDANWSGPVNATIHIDDSESHPDGTFVKITDDETVALGVSGLGAILQLDGGCANYTLSFDISGHITTTDQNGQSTGVVGVLSFAPFDGNPAPLPASGLVLTRSGAATAVSLLGVPGTFTATWTLNPRLDIDVQVRIPNYSTWRPTAGIDELETGLDALTGRFNLLEIQAQLVRKTTQKPLSIDIGPDQWTFSLVKVSHEPGVAMNWPAKSKAGIQADMTFDKLECSKPGSCQPIESNQNYTIIPTDPNFPNGATVASLPFPYALGSVFIFLSPHDWGGWATLNVTATIAGQKILGHLQLDPPAATDLTYTDIRLPQRQPGLLVADRWKTDHGLSLSTPDSDDSEFQPTGDGQGGDGLTLYQEYRGFYIGCAHASPVVFPEGIPGCQHAEGDPQTKDLFVVDVTGGDFYEGIATFQKASGVTVHWFQMTLDDIGVADPANQSAYRSVTFNHLQAPHQALDQHAIVIRWKTAAEETRTPGQSSSELAMGGKSVPGLPKDIDHIQITTLSDLTPEQIRRIVAHEMGHSTNVYHHGDIDKKMVTWKLASPGNVTENGTPIFVKSEGDDPSVPTTTAILFNNVGDSFPVYVGNNVCGGVATLQGQHSGDVFSFMRYATATAYIPSGFPQVRFYTGHRETLGFSLPDSPIGTEVNDPNRAAEFPNHRPGPRYGNAYSGRGNDASQLDVNDNNTVSVKPVQPCQ